MRSLVCDGSHEVGAETPRTRLESAGLVGVTGVGNVFVVYVGSVVGINTLVVAWTFVDPLDSIASAASLGIVMFVSSSRPAGYVPPERLGACAQFALRRTGIVSKQATHSVRGTDHLLRKSSALRRREAARA